MKAELEISSLTHRGISVISETEEEKQVLENIWNQNGRPAMLGRMQDGQIQLVVAPTVEENEKEEP